MPWNGAAEAQVSTPFTSTAATKSARAPGSATTPWRRRRISPAATAARILFDVKPAWSSVAVRATEPAYSR